MTITLSDLKKIARIAHFDEKDFENQLDDINSRLEEIDVLMQIDTTNIEPCIHPSATYQYMRADNVTNNNNIAELADIAPLFIDGNYLVPNTLTKGE